MRKILLLYLLAFSSILGYGENSSLAISKETADATDPIIISDDVITYAFFRTEVSKSQDYYLAFRVLPAWLNDSHFTSYEVFIDQKKVGTITPKCHGWQNLPIDGVEKIPSWRGGTRYFSGSTLWCALE